MVCLVIVLNFTLFLSYINYISTKLIVEYKIISTIVDENHVFYQQLSVTNVPIHKEHHVDTWVSEHFISRINLL
jgi:hypothetical protein